MDSNAMALCTWPEVDARIHRGAGVILPVGATEQHGYHLPLNTDTVLPTELAMAVAAQRDYLVAPPVSYGYRSRPLSGGGQGFVGTTSVQGRTLMALVEDVLAELMRQGFRRLVVLNWHLENANFIYEAARLAVDGTRESDPPQVMVVEQPYATLSPATMALLFDGEFPGWEREHAAIMETSLMRHLRPELVRINAAVDDAAQRQTVHEVIPAPADTIPRSGTLGNATQASAQKGKAAWDEIVDQLITAIDAEAASGLQP